jgi:putative ABC transport system ATP-binding protein
VSPFLPSITVDRVGVVRARRPVLQEISLVAEAGEVLALTGPSGSGKSTLLAVIAGLEPVTTGAIRWGDEVVSPQRRDLRQRWGLVLQGYGLVSLLTAEENVELVLQAQGLPRDEVRERAAVALARVGLEHVGDHLVDQLSGGQQQRAAVARAIVGRPEVLLADEPSAELDASTRDRVLHVLAAEAARGAVVILATHDRAVADTAHLELTLHDGRLQSPAG